MNKIIIALVPIFIAILFMSLDYAFGQEVNNTAATPSTNGTDLGVATGGIVSGLAAAGFALYNDRKDKKDLKENVKGTDVDSAKMFILYNKILQYAYLYPNYTLKQILDLPATANVMDKETLGQVIARETNGWANFIQESYNIARPTMSVATATGVAAAQDAAKNAPPPQTTSNPS